MTEWKSYRVRRLTVVEEVARALRDDWLDRGREAAGESVGEEAVADHFGISRTTARATITELVNGGYLTRLTNRPAQVIELGASYVNDLFRVRRPIELEAVRLITLKRLPVTSAAYDACALLEDRQNDEPHRVIEANLAFHRAIVEGVNNVPLVMAYSALEGQIALALAQSGVYRDSRHAAKEHRRLLKQLERHEWDESKTDVVRHLKESAKAINRKLVEPKGEPARPGEPG